MKCRQGFVSNSSSSSFIVINSGARSSMKDAFTDNEELVADGDLGETEFGWGPGVLRGAGSKINFSFLQSERNTEWRNMLEKVVKEHTGASSIVWNISEEYDSKDKTWGYIDHQSAASEGMNTEMFENEERLKDFLFNDASYIQLDNDNH